MRHVLRQRNFGLLWFGQLISMIGDWVLIIALPFYIYDLTGSALATGVMFMAGTLPRVLLGSVAGVFADRWDRKRIMIVADVLRAVLLVLILAVRSQDMLWLVYVVAFAQATISQFFFPAKGAIIPQLVGEKDLVSANALNSVSDSATRLIGPSLGGLLMAWGGINAVVVVDSLSYLISAIMIVLIVMPSQSATASASAAKPTKGALALWRDWLDGLRLVRSSRLLGGIFVLLAIIGLADAVFTALMVPFIKDVMRSGSQELGLLMAAQGAGGLLGGLVVARLSKKVSPTQWIVLSGFTSGLTLLGIINYPSFWLAVSLIWFAGLTFTGLFVGINTSLQNGTSNEFRGRIFGAMMTVDALLRLIGLALAGALGDVLGVVVVMNIGAVLWLMGGVVTWLILPRNAEGFAVAQSEATPAI